MAHGRQMRERATSRGGTGLDRTSLTPKYARHRISVCEAEAHGTVATRRCAPQNTHGPASGPRLSTLSSGPHEGAYTNRMVWPFRTLATSSGWKAQHEHVTLAGRQLPTKTTPKPSTPNASRSGTPRRGTVELDFAPFKSGSRGIAARAYYHMM